MAKTIATIGGYALAPGVSRNRRWYTAEHISGAVKLAQERLARGDQPMVMLTHHGADDDSTRIAAALREVSLTDDGRVRWAADIPDTDAGRDIAKLTDTSDGRPAFLEGVSIRGAWTGKVRKVRAPDGELAEQGDGLELHGLDFTHKPGVTGARVDTFAWSKGGATETSESVLITESVEEARVTITEETEPVTEAIPAEVREALRALFPPAPADAGVEEAGTPPMSKRGSGTAGGGRVWADPGYQPDKRQRYDITTKAVAKTAWSYINQQSKASKYTPAQLKRIKGRIKAALKKFGVTVAAEGWTVEPAFRVTEALAEMIGMDPAQAGSFSLTACNGPVSLSISSYSLDPADLAVILQSACDAACQALAALDPDMDGDIDVPGADSEDTDRDLGDDSDQLDNGDGTEDLVRRLMAAIKGESAESPEDLLAEARQGQAGTGVAETSPSEPAPEDQAAADRGETEAPMAETTTQEAVGTAPAAPSYSQADLDAAVQRALDAKKAAKAARKAARAAAGETAPAPAAPAAETAPAADPAADLDRLVNERIAAQLAAQGLVETQEQKIERLVAEGVTRAKQELAAQGAGPARKGLVAEHAAPAAAREEGLPADFPMKDGEMIPMEQWSEAQRRSAGEMLQRHVMGARYDADL